MEAIQGFAFSMSGYVDFGIGMTIRGMIKQRRLLFNIQIDS